MNSIKDLIASELNRQNQEINLIASENYVSPAVLQATGSVLTNKYAEGYPSKRYYAGCTVVDEIEVVALEQCKKLFNAEHANVQPHSGTQANMAVYFSCLQPGDTILGMSLHAGGHLSHGYPVSFSGKLFKSVTYGVDKKTELINYDEVAQQAQLHQPKLIIAGASSYSRTIDFKKFAEIANNVGALLMVDMAHIAGLVATGLHPSPVEHADFVTSTTHKTLRGPRGGFVLCKKEYAGHLDKSIMPGLQGGPLMHVIAAKAVAFAEAQQPSFKLYQQQVIKNAQVMVQEFKERGYKIVSDGTDTHQFTLDLRPLGLTGKEAEDKLQSVGITVNRNCIPFDLQKPWIASGVRLGTPAITTRGMQEEEVKEIVDLIDKTFNHVSLSTVRKQVQQLATAYPVYQETEEILQSTNPIDKLNNIDRIIE